jgi:uncharacterized membrane protein (UPF0127 family)
MKNYKWLVIFIIFACLLVGVLLKVSNVNLVKNFNNEQSVNQQNQDIKIEDTNSPQIKIADQTFLVEVAIDPAIQKKGLSGRDSLAENAGVIFVYPSKSILAFWMVDTKFNIDLLWINDDKIVGLERNMLVPVAGTEDKDLLIYRSPEAVDRVLEINSGLVDKYGIKVGDKLEYKNINF